jgi:hypothetical protein
VQTDGVSRRKPDEQADALMTYSENGQPFEEAELEALEQAFNASKDYLQLAYPRF